ncbi:hypothetical protein BJY00DRAFT_323976 [Aspergillus carlsbadensis]|nr:hypothetical protein BJY00DRAFT_323976 [Aspergillus carlsbadensis]
MPRIQALARDGPYGGQGGSAYNATHNEQKIRHIDAWGATYDGYPVLGALQFVFEDGTPTGRIGGRDPGIGYTPEPPFDFQDGETIESMNVYAGDGEGFCNGFEFHTNRGRDYSAGTKIGLKSAVEDLGRDGEWAGASGRDGQHGADAVVDNMILYFKN